MQIVDPERIRLVPGESIHGMYEPKPEEPAEIGMFVRATSDFEILGTDPEIQQRAGLIKFNDVLLVVTMIKVTGLSEEYFDVWWNYHTTEGPADFQRMAKQERLSVHFYDAGGRTFSVDMENSFQKFFSDLSPLLAKSGSWTDVEFDRALRGFCAKSYPKDNLWQMIEVGTHNAQPPESTAKKGGIENYPGEIPIDLRDFYVYLPELGHCIRVIPSLLEESAMEGVPEDFLHPAPVKTVLRCGIRWKRGFPVAPIPFIPGHGLAVPPEDTEL